MDAKSVKQKTDTLISLKNGILKLMFACLVLFLSFSCEDEDLDQTDDLTAGYWACQTEADVPLIRFYPSGEMLYFLYAPNGVEGGYDAACYDAELNLRYAVDFENGRLCYLPSMWFDILVLNESTLTIRTDDGLNIKYAKIRSSSVNLMSKEEFYNKYPEY